MRHRIVLAAAFAYLAIANLVWIARDTRPPFWDMAEHQRDALEIYDALATNGLAGLPQTWSATLPYPPLYHSIVSVFYALFGKTVNAAQYANIPAILVLLLATYGIGRTVLKPLSAAFAATVVSFYPILLWLSRETIIDYWLTSMVAVSVWLLLQTRNFSDTRWCIALGVVAGLGMLTKWTFPFFIALPFLWLARSNWKNAALAGAITAAIAAAWYLPASDSLVQLLGVNSGQSLREGDPSRFSWQALVFYVRVLEGYQIFLPLFAGFVAGAVMLAKRFDKAWIPIILWIAGGWACLLIFQNKDPRYSAPLLPAIALITARIVEERRAFILPILAILVFQHHLVSFGVPQLPQAVVLAKGVEGPLSWNWNLYTQQYFDLWGPPAKEDWRIEYVLQKIARNDGQPVRLSLVPDIPRFDWFAFRFHAALGKFPVAVDRLFEPDERTIAGADYILISPVDQGPQYAAPGLGTVGDYIASRPLQFQAVDSFALPNGNVIALYKVNHS